MTDKTCRQLTDLVFNYLTDKLSPSLLWDFEQHLSICPDCVSFLHTYKKTVAVTQSVRVEEIPPKVRESILAFLHKRIGKIAAALLIIATHLLAKFIIST